MFIISYYSKQVLVCICTCLTSPGYIAYERDQLCHLHVNTVITELMHSVCPSLWKGSKCEGSRKIVFGDTKTGPFVYSVSSGPVSLQILWSLYTWVNSDIEGPLKKNKGEKDCKCCCVSVNNVPRCMCVVSSCYHSHKAEVVTWITVWTRINFFFHSAKEIYSYLCHFLFIVWLLCVLNG